MKCDHWSVINKQCKFNYTPHPFISDADLNPRCNGEVNKTICAWYICGDIDLAGNDKLNKYLRSRMRKELNGEN